MNTLHKITVALLAVCLLCLSPSAAMARASYRPAGHLTLADRNWTMRVTPPSRLVAHKHLVTIQTTARGFAYVKFNNGAAWSVRPCPEEDSERCWWNAGERGNGFGHSFVRLGHHTYYLDAPWGKPS